MITIKKFLVLLILLSSRICLFSQPLIADLVNSLSISESDRLENISNKTILVFTPHPDDETFSMGGTLALLSPENNIHIVIYTNDNKGSKDLEMTRERLEHIRRAEEEKSCEILGIPSQNIHWLGYDDGDLEYAEPQILRGQIARLIKIHRPDVIFAPDPGTRWVQWHKTDHRMAAQITNDAFIASEWHLYYPQHLLDEDLQPFDVKDIYFYYSQEPNYEVDITTVFDQKIKAATAHVSQFDPSTAKYTSEMDQEVYNAIYEGFKARCQIKEGLLVERFRKVGG